MVVEDLFIASSLFVVGAIIFGRFEERTPLWRRLTKFTVFLAFTALISFSAGRPWSLLWIIGMMGVGLTFHIWWTRKHGIGVFSAEPRDKYYELRGWTKSQIEN